MSLEIDTALAAVGLKLVNVVVAGVASFAALRFFDDLSKRDRWLTFVGGWAAAAWGAAPLREYFDMKPSVEVGLVILLGLFGMALASEAIKLVRGTDWKGILQSLLTRRGGGEG